jgi:hypothetical protein
MGFIQFQDDVVTLYAWMHCATRYRAKKMFCWKSTMIVAYT